MGLGEFLLLEKKTGTETWMKVWACFLKNQ
jgi:hypothetical protein